MLNNKEKSADQSKTVRFSGVVAIDTRDQKERSSKNRSNTGNYKDEVKSFYFGKNILIDNKLDIAYLSLT